MSANASPAPSPGPGAPNRRTSGCAAASRASLDASSSGAPGGRRNGANADETAMRSGGCAGTVHRASPGGQLRPRVGVPISSAGGPTLVPGVMKRGQTAALTEVLAPGTELGRVLGEGDSPELTSPRGRSRIRRKARDG